MPTTGWLKVKYPRRAIAITQSEIARF